MKTISLMITCSLLIVAIHAFAAEADPSDKNPKGAGVISTGNTAGDVCNCNASSKPLVSGPQYDSLLPDHGGGASEPASGTGSSASGTK